MDRIKKNSFIRDELGDVCFIEEVFAPDPVPIEIKVRGTATRYPVVRLSPCTDFRAGDHIRRLPSGAPRMLYGIIQKPPIDWIYEVESVKPDPTPPFDQPNSQAVRCAGVNHDFYSREIEHVGKDIPVSKYKFNIGDKVKINTKKEDFGEGFEDAWELSNGRTFIVKHVFGPPFNTGVQYGCKWVNRILEEAWLTASNEEPWSPHYDRAPQLLSFNHQSILTQKLISIVHGINELIRTNE